MTRTSRRARTWTPALLIATLVASCGDVNADSGEGASGAALDQNTDSATPVGAPDASTIVDDASAGAASGGIRLDEAQVVGVLSAFDVSELEAAALARARAGDPRVAAYVAQLARAQLAAQRRLHELGIVSAPSPQSAAAAASGVTILQALQRQPDGPRFDAAYVDLELMAQGGMAALIDDVLIPNTASPALRDELATRRAQAAEREQQAVSLRALQRDAGAPQ